MFEKMLEKTWNLHKNNMSQYLCQCLLLANDLTLISSPLHLPPPPSLQQKKPSDPAVQSLRNLVIASLYISKIHDIQPRKYFFV